MRNLILLLGFLLLANCGGPGLKLASGPEGTLHHQMAEHMIPAWQASSAARVDNLGPATEGSRQNAEALLNGTADLALVQNDVRLSHPEASQLRTLMPVYRQYLLILYRASLPDGNLAELVNGRRIGVGPKDGGTAQLVKALLDAFGVDSTSYTLVYTHYSENVVGDQIDVSCSMTSLSDPRVLKMLRSQMVSLFSLDDAAWAGNGSAVDGFVMNYPLAQTVLLPRNTWPGLPSEPTLTLAVDNVLLARRDLDDQTAYALIEALHNQRAHLDDTNLLLRDVAVDYRAQAFRYPLHPAAVQFLDRDKPTLLERYAEVLGLGITLASILYAGLLTLARIREKRYLNRLEVYYAEVVSIEAKAYQLDNRTECQQELHKLQDIRARASEQLLAERLPANESFSILLRLLEQARKTVLDRLHELPGELDD